MSFLKRVKDITGDLAEGTKRGAQRGKLELEVRRVEGRIADEKNAIGQAIFPLIESGALVVADANVTELMAKIATLAEELAAKRKEIADLGDDGDAVPAAAAQDGGEEAK